MKRLAITLLLIIPAIISCYGQSNPSDQKFSAAQLKDDLAYLQQQLYTVHVYPYTELNKAQYDQLFSNINTKITDSLTATAFLKLVKPTIAYLCDEHAQASLPVKSLDKVYRDSAVFLPFALSKQGNIYKVAKVLSTQSELAPGEAIASINNVTVDSLLKRCALFTSGYPDQRLQKAMQQFGYLYSWSESIIQANYSVKTGSGRAINVVGVPIKVWQDELNKQTGWDNTCDEKISYQKINDVAYINACSFNIPPKQLDSIHKKIDDIFTRIQQDKPKYLFIDISKNSGGQSVVGQMLLDGFNDKPFRGFSQDFKRSESYIKLLKSWGATPDDYYVNAPEGKVFHFASDTTFPQPRADRFKGKVFIIVGNGTFSSAMMMATWVKDNHLAVIAGETPMLGHPNGFGELYNTKLPNTKINILFGVKRWIRPGGDLNDNLLRPDIQVKLTDDREMLIKSVLKKAGF